MPFYGREGFAMQRAPKAISQVLSELMSRRGYARVQGAAAYDAAWREAAGPLAAQYTRPGQLRRGTLEVVVANSTLVQELGFQKQSLLRALASLLPDEGIENLRFRVGNIG
jgi:predicted nucleic acid-binding Zn ribbon protein